MDLQKMLDQQKSRNLKSQKPLVKPPSFEEYLTDGNAPRPYNVENVIAAPSKLTIIPIKATSQIGTALQKRSDTEATQQSKRSDTEATQQSKRSDTEATQVTTQKITVKNRVGRPELDTIVTYSQLRGNALKIINAIYLECIKRKQLETQFIEKSLFSQRVMVKKGSIRTTCVRLRERAVLNDFIATKGPGASWKFVLSESIYNQMTLESNANNLINSDTHSNTKMLSSSSNINTTTTIQLPDPWKKIKYDHLQKVLNHFGERFGLSQMKSIYREIENNLTAEEVQKSIDHFVYSLEHCGTSPFHNRKVKIATLLETLKNGEVFKEFRYVSPEEEKRHRLNKEIEQKKKEIEENVFEEKFRAYFAGLSQTEIEDIVPDEIKKTDNLWQFCVRENKPESKVHIEKEWARKFYRKFKWPHVVNKLLES